MACRPAISASSVWADLHSELLSVVFTKVSFKSTLACQCVCRSWRSCLSGRSAPEISMWGKQLTLVQERPFSPEEPETMIFLPGRSRALSLFKWIECRLSSWKYIEFGTDKAKLFINTIPEDIVPALDLGYASLQQQIFSRCSSTPHRWL